MQCEPETRQTCQKLPDSPVSDAEPDELVESRDPSDSED